MKRYVVGTLLFSIVMFVQLFGNIPVFADTFVPTSSYDFIGLADLGYALVGGAEFDFSETPYTIDNYNSLSAEQKEIAKSLKAREFLQDYLESRGIAYEENGELQKGSAYYTIAFGLAGQEFFEAFQTATAAEQEDLEYNMPISPSRFADWAQYNKYWFNRYVDSFDNSEPIYVNPDPAYLSFIDVINGSGTAILSNYNARGLWIGGYSANSYVQYLQVNNDSSIASFNGRQVQTSEILTINIYSSNDTYTFSVSSVPVQHCDQPKIVENSIISYTTICYDDASTIYAISSLNRQVLNRTRTGTLSQIFYYIANNFKNVNIYVDGEPWSIVSNPSPANPVIPDFPDIINQDTGELAYDIAMPKTQDYSGSFDLTSLFDAIREGIAGASDGDLATGSTIGSLDVGRTYTGEGIDIQDRVIDLTSSRVFDGTLTDDTTGRLPKPPVVPPAVSAGLGGVTVLAKYVDATQCILPDELITAFWGCVWILIILGLIKNLHR